MPILNEPQTYDTIIIGGGPGGSCAGAILAEYGHRTLILEREKFPRYHIGESLIPFTFQPLQRIGMIRQNLRSPGRLCVAPPHLRSAGRTVPDSRRGAVDRGASHD